MGEHIGPWDPTDHDAEPDEALEEELSEHIHDGYEPCPLCGTDPMLLRDARMEIVMHAERLMTIAKRLRDGEEAIKRSRAD